MVLTIKNRNNMKKSFHSIKEKMYFSGVASDSGKLNEGRKRGARD